MRGRDAGDGRSSPPASPGELLEAVRLLGPDSFSDPNINQETTLDWYYAPGEYELATLSRIVADGFATNKHVHYSDNYGRPAGQGSFRRRLGVDERRVHIRATGTLFAYLDGRSIPANSGPDGMYDIPACGPGLLEITVTTKFGAPAAIAHERDGARWASALSREADWSIGDVRPGCATAPHLLGEPTVMVELQPTGNGIWTAPAPLFGYPQVIADRVPRLSGGESEAEAFAEERLQEHRTVIYESAPGTWSTHHPLAISVLRIQGVDAERVSVLASIRPTPRRGGFLSDDDTLNRIWSTSAYTLRLCMQKLVLDGVKRDRMPWIGDQALSIIANAYAFADGQIVRDGLAALGRIRHGYINGISDYSLWWVIAHHTHLRYFGDTAFAEREAELVHAFVTNLAQHSDRDGVLRPPVQQDGFTNAGPGSVFIDWGVHLEADRDPVALQMLWYWALRSAANVLRSASHPDATRWDDVADRIEATLLSRGWNHAMAHWRTYLDEDDEEVSGYPNFLASLAGLEPRSPGDGIRDAVLGARAGTPFMRSFALQAQGLLGDRSGAVAQIRDDWGAMLAAGAGTFWEDFPEPGSSPYEMYGRPFGKSLCHAWAAGPAALLPQLVLGISPLTDGWRQFEVAPELGALRWASAAVPVPGGVIFVTADSEAVCVHVPQGHTLIREGIQSPGPCQISWSTPPTEKS